MNETDVAGILRTYAELARYARNTKHLRDILRRLKAELDLRKVKFNGDKNA